MKKSKKKKLKNNLEIIKEKRNIWTINPVIRVKENELKNKKKRRNKGKKMIDNYLKKDQSFFYTYKYIMKTSLLYKLKILQIKSQICYNIHH
jgi:hypothetical protein